MPIIGKQVQSSYSLKITCFCNNKFDQYNNYCLSLITYINVFQKTFLRVFEYFRDQLQIDVN